MIYKPKYKGTERWLHFQMQSQQVKDLLNGYAHGTTTKPEDCSLLYIGKKHALVKRPGGSYWSGIRGNSFCSAWVDRVPIADPGIRNHREVWNGKGKRLTKAIVAQLIAKLKAYENDNQ